MPVPTSREFRDATKTSAETQSEWVYREMKQVIFDVASMFECAKYYMFGHNTYSANSTATLDAKEKELKGLRNAAVNTMAGFLSIDSKTKSKNMEKFMSMLDGATAPKAFQNSARKAVMTETEKFIRIANMMSTKNAIIGLMSDVATESLPGYKPSIMLKDQKDDGVWDNEDTTAKELADMLDTNDPTKLRDMKCILFALKEDKGIDAVALSMDKSVEQLFSRCGMQELISAGVVRPTAPVDPEYVLTPLGREIARLLELPNILRK